MEATYFKIHYLVSETKRKALAECIADWLGVEPKEENGKYVIDYFTLDSDGTLSFDDRVDSEVIERLLEHNYDEGFEFMEDKNSASVG